MRKELYTNHYIAIDTNSVHIKSANVACTLCYITFNYIMYVHVFVHVHYLIVYIYILTYVQAYDCTYILACMNMYWQDASI